MEQPYVKDQNITVGDLVREHDCQDWREYKSAPLHALQDGRRALRNVRRGSFGVEVQDLLSGKQQMKGLKASLREGLF